jgi:F-type H+-transporting ATPase subunit delta
VTARAAARRYARALFDVGRAERLDLDRMADELAGVAALIAGQDALRRVLANPAIPAARKRGVMEQLLQRSPVTPALSRLLLLLAARDRLVLVPDVSDAYRSRLLEHRRVVQAHVTTAAPLPPDRVAALQQGLAAATGREVRLDVRVDAALVGGAVARIGSTVYDGSITTQLERMKQRLAAAE